MSQIWAHLVKFAPGFYSSATNGGKFDVVNLRSNLTPSKRRESQI
ncbi:hypothetical protein [Campylobacter showae]|nr:hypothetical protein [Campylobacter showae]